MGKHNIKMENIMKTLIITTAALAMTATAAFAAQPLNSDGERKNDFASLQQAAKGAVEIEFGSADVATTGGFDYEPTASIGSSLGAGPVSVNRTPDGQGGRFIRITQRDASGNLVVISERHERN